MYESNIMLKNIVLELPEKQNLHLNPYPIIISKTKRFNVFIILMILRDLIYQKILFREKGQSKCLMNIEYGLEIEHKWFPSIF